MCDAIDRGDTTKKSSQNSEEHLSAALVKEMNDYIYTYILQYRVTSNTLYFPNKLLQVYTESSRIYSKSLFAKACINLTYVSKNDYYI